MHVYILLYDKLQKYFRGLLQITTNLAKLKYFLVFSGRHLVFWVVKRQVDLPVYAIVSAPILLVDPLLPG